VKFPLYAAALATLAALSVAQQAGPDVKLPSGKSQHDEILKESHQKTLRDLDRLIETAKELKTELEDKDYHVLSISALKKAEDMEKLSRSIKGRLRRF
jgi:hypothetical protein